VSAVVGQSDFHRARTYDSFRRSIPAMPTMPEPNRTMLLGSGVVPLALPKTENDSEGTGPSSLSQPCEGQPGEWQPMREFSSQKTASPSGTLAFCRFNQYVPLGRVGPLRLPVSVQTLKPYWLAAAARGREAHYPIEVDGAAVYFGGKGHPNRAKRVPWVQPCTERQAGDGTIPAGDGKGVANEVAVVYYPSISLPVDRPVLIDYLRR
jgi:hypothetical protein